LEAVLIIFFRTDLAIINRTFWPHNHVIGEALLQFAEKVSGKSKVCIIIQAQKNIKSVMSNEGRGKTLKVCALRIISRPKSGLFVKSFESLLFMFWVLLQLLVQRPRKLYVATDPPLIVPFIVFLYCKLFNAKYYYHLQDIHPEATNVIYPINKTLLRFFIWIDNITLEHSKSLITISEDMKMYILERCKLKKTIHLLANPSFKLNLKKEIKQKNDIIFCGNVGRLQRIPLLLEAIKIYSEKGGNLKFTFIGNGFYEQQLSNLSTTNNNVNYLGYLPANKAASIVASHKWALLPIEDKVTKYAFPSKSSSYVLSGCNIIAICGSCTSVAQWIWREEIGIVCDPDIESIVECFFAIENNRFNKKLANKELTKKLAIDTFVEKLLLFTEFSDV